MNKIILILVCFSILILSPSLCQADYLSVSRSATIKSEPHRDGAIIARVAKGDLLPLLDDDQTDGYYHVSAPNNAENGWIYKTLVRRHEGSIPVVSSAAPATGNPMVDHTMSLTDTQLNYARGHLQLGKPQAVYERVREGYVLGYDSRLKIPLWVQYILTRETKIGTAERKNDFREDTSIPEIGRSQLNDYSNSGFDRGHMAPANDMKRSVEVMSESFLLSNIVPQVGSGFNQHIWKSLELAINGWVDQRGTLTIITGPIFAVNDSTVEYKVIGDNHVAVPTHYYKIVVDANDPGDVNALAFIMENRKLTGRKYKEFMRSIDEIEELTGLDFLHALPDEVENEIEAVTAQQVW